MKLIVIFGLFGGISGATFDDATSKSIWTYETMCDGLKKGPDAAENEERKELYYQCLPYITGANRGKDVFFPEASTMSLFDAPPATRDPEKKTAIRLERIAMPTFHVLGETDFRPDIEIEISVSWNDERLQWNPDTWNMKNFPVELKPSTNFWAPKFSTKANSRLNILFDLLSYYSSSIDYSGRVNATLGGQLVFSDCQMDVSTYPYDDIDCCLDFAISGKDNRAKFDKDQLSGTEMVWDTKQGGVWSVRKMEFTAKKLDSNKGKLEGGQLCVSARRNTAALGVELSLPMGVSAVVMLCAQFAGKWRMQVYVKLFALLVQVIAFQTLIPNEAMSVATTMPRVYSFYNFTVAMTLISLIQTMILWALSRRWFLTPPPHRVTLLLDSSGRCLMGDSASREPYLETQQDQASRQVNGSANGAGGSAGSGGKWEANNRREWELVFAALHAVLSLLIAIIYLIGICILFF